MARFRLQRVGGRLLPLRITVMGPMMSPNAPDHEPDVTVTGLRFPFHTDVVHVSRAVAGVDQVAPSS